MSLRSHRGQASAEYLGVVLVVAAILAALAATAVAAPGLTGAVVERFKYALCVVGLDVCDAAHARSKGLEPCVTLAKQRERGVSGLVGVFTGEDGDTLRIERRSDGSYVVSAGNAPQLGIESGGSFHLWKAKLGATASAKVEFGSGMRWEARSLAEVKAFLGKDIDDPHDALLKLQLFRGLLPAERVTTYRELGTSAGLEASLGLDGDDGQSEEATAVEAAVRHAVGRSRRDGVSTYYYDVGMSAGGPLSDVLSDVEGRRMSVAWQRSDPPVMTVSAAGPKRDGRRSETVTRFVLARADDRALARRWVLTAGAVGDSAGRGLAARLRDAATTQRFTYAERDYDEGSFEAEVKLVAGLGLGRKAKLTHRELVDAQVLGLPAGGRRLDCLPGQATTSRKPAS